MNPVSPYIVLEEHEYNSEFVLSFLEEHYFTREPLLTKYMQIHAQAITPQHRNLILGDLRRYYEPIVRNCCMTLVGVHVETGLHCGMSLAMLERREDQGTVPEWDRVPFTSRLLAMWYCCVQMVAERQRNLFELFPDVNNIMRIVMIGVDQQHERRRMGSKMLRQIVIGAKHYGAELIYGLFTSDHLKRVAERYGFSSFVDMNLSDFRDPQGNAMYTGVSPQVVSLMVIRVT